MTANARTGFVRAPSPTTVQVRRMVKERDGHRCVRCGSTRRLTIHHIRPIAAGGSAMDLRNMETLCRTCHRKQHQSEPRP